MSACNTPEPKDLHAIIPAAGMGRRMGPSQRGPKSLIAIDGQEILLRTLSTLESRGIRRLSLVVGFEREYFIQRLGNAFGNLSIQYVVSEEYATTEHGWSLYLTKDIWMQSKQPVLFMDADNVFEPALLDHLLQATGDDLVLIDPSLNATDEDEELVLGKEGRITGFVRGRSQDHTDYVGGFVGMNRFSPAYMTHLFEHMDALFAERGGMFKYERVFDDLLQNQGIGPEYLDIGKHAWINVNSQGNLKIAHNIVSKTPS